MQTINALLNARIDLPHINLYDITRFIKSLYVTTNKNENFLFVHILRLGFKNVLLL